EAPARHREILLRLRRAGARECSRTKASLTASLRPLFSIFRRARRASFMYHSRPVRGLMVPPYEFLPSPSDRIHFCMICFIQHVANHLFEGLTRRSDVMHAIDKSQAAQVLADPGLRQ